MSLNLKSKKSNTVNKESMRKKLIKKLPVLLAIIALFLTFNYFKNFEQNQYSTLRASVAGKVVRVLDPVSGRSGGTGFHVKAKSGKTYILTNHHVCMVAGPQAKKGDGVLVIGASGQPTFKKIVAIYPLHDLCLIEPIAGIEGLDVASKLSYGQLIYSVGHPLLNPLTMTKGEASSIGLQQFMWGEPGIKQEDCNGSSFMFIPLDVAIREFGQINSMCVRQLSTILTTVQILPGNSGSPIVNSNGEVSGVVFLGTNGLGWAGIIPVEEVKSFLSDK